ncbi:PPK2 family polyphosphate kinase [uncultured Gemmiger sp.]|uniref:PPK2 family polyphosphate kinase n=1 Tax=uncultured Gemmiger sp. TaxID=1623490 RepID=UPI0026655814|nr:PPK2 family polyphosphate kinase [uncultured Gemmiger sp.]
MKADRYRFDGSRRCDLRELPCDGKQDNLDKEQILAKTARNLQEMASLQDALYADGREGLIFVLQALDAAGKDSTVKHVMGGLNPQGVLVTSFKQPNSEELSHDYLWRVHKALPPRGSIAIFNRSYYEDVLVVQVHDLQKTYKMPPRTLGEGKKSFFQKRYRQIRHYEEYLYDNGYRVVKIFLHVSKEEQRKRFLARIDNPAKNWKFSLSDVKERAHFDEYMDIFETVINETASEESPWFVLPADQKWYTRYLVSEIVVDTLRQCCHEYPRLRDDARAELQDCRTRLEAEE